MRYSASVRAKIIFDREFRRSRLEIERGGGERERLDPRVLDDDF